MTKKVILNVLSAAAILTGSGLFAPAVFADATTVSTFDELDAALCEGGDIILGDDILADGWLASGCDYFVTKDTTIDFNGHTITSPANRSYNLDFYESTLTFEDSVGGGGYIQEGDETSGINITNGTFILNGGIVNGSMWVVTLWHDSELIMNGGEINASNGFAITGNGTTNPSSANYGSNTRITINNGYVTSANDYAIYNPSENSTVDIYGGTITGGSGAIAANRGVLTINGGELVSYGTAEVSGDVAQDGTRGYENAVIGIPKEYGPVTLNITGGKFVNDGGSELIADVSGLDNENAAIVSITGGTFAEEPAGEFIAEGYLVYEGSNGTVYNVLPVMPEPEGSDESEDEEAEANSVVLGDAASEVLKALLDNFADLPNDPYEIVLESEGTVFTVAPDYARAVLRNGIKITAELTDEMFSEDELYDDEVEALNEVLTDEMTVFGYVDFEIGLSADDGLDMPLGTVTKLPTAIKLSYDVSAAPEVEEGATRTWYAIRLHLDPETGEYVATILEAEYDEETGLVSFESDEFSAFVLVYTDATDDEPATDEPTDNAEDGEEEPAASETAAPDTGTITATGASAMSAGIITAIATVILASIASLAYIIRKK